jgi:hypothetical protein
MPIEMTNKHVMSFANDPACRIPLLEDLLPHYLMARRWYASKGDTAPSVTIEAYVAVPGLADALILLLGVKGSSGTTRSYLFPIRMIWGCEQPKNGIICEIRAGPAGGWLVDGFSDDGFVCALLEAVRQADAKFSTYEGLAF